MLTFREIAPNKFILLKDSLLTAFKHDTYLNKLYKCRSLEFERKEERRGTNDKFWLVNSEFNNQLIFKSNHRPRSVAKENGYIYGELITDLICNKIGVDNTSYYPCLVILENGSCMEGTVSPNYRKGKYNYEYSAENITTRYIKSQYDNNYGQVPHIEYNTVYEYVKQLKTLYKNKFNEAKYKEFKQYLLEVALLDYVTCQTDRHWGNIGWMSNSELGIQTMKYIPIYDNESCFLMNKSLEWLEDFNQKIEKTKKGKTSVLEPVLNGTDRVPRLGIKTSMVVCKDTFKLIKKPAVPGQKSNTEVFREELAEEIIENKDLQKFYRKIKSFDLEKVLQDCEYFPEYITSIASKIWNIRVEQLEKEIQNKLEEQNQKEI